MGLNKHTEFAPITAELGWIHEELNDTGNTLVIAFSSSQNTFEWVGILNESLADMDLNKIFVIDCGGAWWHGYYTGLQKHGLLGMTDFLQEKIELCKPKRVVMVGASRGGYGAMLAGCIMRVDVVMAFSPRRGLFYDYMEVYELPKRFATLEEMYPGFKIDHTYMQLEDVLRMTENNKTIYNIFYGNMHSIDTEIANIIKDIKPEQTVLHSYNTDSHKVAKKLRNRGELDKIIREVCV